jgi:ubiquinone/menaquinone biosynthesis C-methylase UbiE
MAAPPPLYGSEQSRFARYLEGREAQRPDLVARELRRRLLAGARGRVLELGCGDGRAFEHYPPEVTSVLAVEPDPTARAAALGRAGETAIPIEVVDGDAGSLPEDDGSVHVAVIVWVLCSVPDPAAALRELRRVLVPGGELRFYEHVRSRNPVFLAASSWTMSAPPTSSPATKTCGIVGQLETAESSSRMRGSGRTSTAVNPAPTPRRAWSARSEFPQ